MFLAYAVGVCFGRVFWTYALSVYFGRMLREYALGVCFEFMALECMSLGASLWVRSFGHMSLGV